MWKLEREKKKKKTHTKKCNLHLPEQGGSVFVKVTFHLWPHVWKHCGRTDALLGACTTWVAHQHRQRRIKDERQCTLPIHETFIAVWPTFEWKAYFASPGEGKSQPFPTVPPWSAIVSTLCCTCTGVTLLTSGRSASFKWPPLWKWYIGAEGRPLRDEDLLYLSPGGG